MKFRDIRLNDEIFEHVDLKGKRRFFNVTAMKRAAPSIARRYSSPIEKTWIDYIVKFRGLEEEKIKRLVAPWLNEPIITIDEEDGTTLTVDGHHRMVLWHREGRAYFRHYNFALGTWEQFLIEDIPFGLHFVEGTKQPIDKGEAHVVSTKRRSNR